MRALLRLAAAVLAVAPAASAAQLADRSIGVEVGFTSPSGLGVEAHAPVALAAGFWIEGGLSVTARASVAFAPRTGGRETDLCLGWAAGLRWDASSEDLRPFLFGEIGWLHVLGAGARSAFAPGAGAGIEAFVRRDLSVAAQVAARAIVVVGGEGGRALDAALRLSYYF